MYTGGSLTTTATTTSWTTSESTSHSTDDTGKSDITLYIV